MKIIGAGFPRTGTLSTQAALTTLGFPCYHMAAVAMRPDHIRAWRETVCEGTPMDWHGLFADFEATVDAPAAFFWRELLGAFPDAKVLLNVRDPESWYASYERLYRVMEEFVPYRAGNPVLDEWLTMLEALNRRVVGDAVDPVAYMQVFEEHNRRVREEVPAGRLLVFRVQDGWEPLCDFLGCEVPDEPFPHLNEGTDTLRLGLRMIFGIED